MLAVFLAVAGLIYGMISSAVPAFASTSDKQTSSQNDKLSCTLSVAVQDGKAVVTWTITGATGVTIDPLNLGGKVPVQGSQTIDDNE